MAILSNQEDRTNDNANSQEDQQQQRATSTLSKSWSVCSAHVPSYSGGKVVLGYGVPSQDTPFFLAPCSGDISLIDANRGIKVGTVSTPHGLTFSTSEAEEEEEDVITAYALSPRNDLVTISRTSILRHQNLTTTSPAKNKLIGKSGHVLPVTHSEFHRSGTFFATGSVDGLVKVWDLRAGYATHSFPPPKTGVKRAVTGLSWCPDSTSLWLAIGREDGSVLIHDLRNKNATVELFDHVSAVTCMVWTGPAFRFFFTAGRDAVINTWIVGEAVADEEDGHKRKKTKGIPGQDTDKTVKTKVIYRRIRTLPIYEQIEGLVLLPQFYQTHFNGSNFSVHKLDVVLATAGSKGMVRIWKASCLDDSGSISGLHCIAEQPAAFGEARGGYTGLLLASCKHGLVSKLESEATWLEELIAIDAEHNLSFLSLSGAVESKHQSLLALDRCIVGHNDEILDLRILPSAVSGVRKVAVATNSAQVRLFELGTYSCEVLDGHTDTVLSLDVSPCGRYLATCGKDKTMRLWHLGNGGNKCVAVATGHTEAIGATALSRKTNRYEVVGKAAKNGGGAFAVTASKDRTLKMWALPGASVFDECANSDKNEELLVLFSARAHEKDINIVTVAPNDAMIATGSQDKTVKLWNSVDLTLKGTLKGHKRGVWDCQFSPFDRVVATCSGDKTIKLWSLADFNCVRTFQGHSASSLRVRFLSGGLQLVSSGADGLVKLWTIRTNECDATMDGHNDKVWAMDLSSDGTVLVSGGADSKIVVWTDTTKLHDDEKREEEQKNILMEQKLSNHLLFKEYEQALEISFDMDKPRQALKVLVAIVENDLTNGRDCLFTLQQHVTSWPLSRTSQVLRYCREWNTRARNSHIAMLTVKAIARSIPAHTLASADGVSEVVAGIIPYSERHFERLDRLHASSYLIDFTLLSMGNLDTDDNENYTNWEANSKLVLPPKRSDGRLQIGELNKTKLQGKSKPTDDDGSDAEILSLGDSNTSSDNSIDSEDEIDEDEIDEDETVSSVNPASSDDDASSST